MLQRPLLDDVKHELQIHLSTPERIIIERLFGFDNDEPVSNEKLAHSLSISPKETSDIINESLRKLRRASFITNNVSSYREEEEAEFEKWTLQSLAQRIDT